MVAYPVCLRELCIIYVLFILFSILFLQVLTKLILGSLSVIKSRFGSMWLHPQEHSLDGDTIPVTSWDHDSRLVTH